MPRQTLTRITLFLPAPSTLRQHYLIDDVITDLVEFCKGATTSQQIPPVVSGYWLNLHGLVEEDQNVLIIADAEQDIDDANLNSFFENLKFIAQIDFNQDLIWITLHKVERVATDDPQP